MVHYGAGTELSSKQGLCKFPVVQRSTDLLPGPPLVRLHPLDAVISLFLGQGLEGVEGERGTLNRQLITMIVYRVEPDPPRRGHN